MRVVLDLDALLASGRIDESEYRRLAGLASGSVGQLALRLLLSAGLIMLCAGAVWLVPEAQRSLIAAIAGLLLATCGLIAARLGPARMQPAGAIMLTAGVGLAALGILHQSAGQPGFLALALDAFVSSAVALFFAAAGRSVLLAVTGMLLANLGIFMLARNWQPAALDPVTALMIGAAVQALAMHALWRRLPDGIWRRMAASVGIAAAAIVNACLADRSLIAPPDADWPTAANNVHALVWTVLLAGSGWLAVAGNRRWAVNMTALFVLVHILGQWFRRFDASALSLFVAGVLLVAFAFAVHCLNSRRQLPAAAGGSP